MKGILSLMNYLRMFASQQRKGPARTDDVHRLPKAVKDEHGLIKHGFHTQRALEISTRQCPVKQRARLSGRNLAGRTKEPPSENQRLAGRRLQGLSQGA